MESLASCPISAAVEPAEQPLALEPIERLCVPHRKRLSHAYVVDDRGARALRIDYGLKEIIFDDERFFAFGERLVAEASFTGQGAMAWGDGYAWDEIRPLLESLLDEGILRRGDGSDDPRGGGLVPSPLPPAECPVPRFWSLAECEAITRDLAGRAVELGHLEAVMPIFRIAHAALDADGRQVGEANVFPPLLRLDRETEWRVCQYAGNRYRDEMPMNVTALKAMIKHWKPIMAAILQVRGELQTRLGLSRDRWAIGDLHVLACAILALPAFALLQGGGASPQPPLHPVLSSLFRITDGVRMTTEDMMFTIEHARGGDEPMTAAELHGHAEHFGVLINRTGVCAGPKHLIEEFLATIVDGVPPEGVTVRDLPAEVAALFARLPEAIDYGLHGVQVWAVSASVWIAMSRAYEALLAVLEIAVPAAAGDDWARLRARLRADWRGLERMQITIDHERYVHVKGYVDHYTRSRGASRSPVGPPTYAQAIAPGPAGPMHAAVADQLRTMFCARSLHGELADPEATIEQIVGVLVRYLREEQAILTSALEILGPINALLDRPRPQRALGVRDLHVNYAMGPNGHAFPYLFESLADELGIRVECTATAIDVYDLRAS
ncbi:MAG TPA: hypothetical protein VF469_38500 [Kofleriaceae bacterium]